MLSKRVTTPRLAHLGVIVGLGPFTFLLLAILLFLLVFFLVVLVVVMCLAEDESPISPSNAKSSIVRAMSNESKTRPPPHLFLAEALL